MPTSKRRSKDSFAAATTSFQMNIPEIVSLSSFEVWRNEFCYYFYVETQFTGARRRFMSFRKTFIYTFPFPFPH